ncbi:Ankyrin-1 [Penicillium rolfsii]|nr:Ankyrin-1 [Penicillium rolfsii]
MQSRSPVSLGVLPRELVLEIAAHLDVGSLNSLSQTCRELNNLLDPEITKQALQSSLAPRSHYEKSFVYNNDQEHGVDFPAFRVRFGRIFDQTVAYYQRSIPPAYVPTEFEPLGQAIYWGNFDGVRNLLERGVNPNSYLVNGARVLSVAVESENMDIVKLLLEFGANSCCKDPGLRTSPLERAARRGDIDVIRAMLLAECEVSSCITLHEAVFYRKDVVELLIPLMDKSSFNITNSGGQTALHLAMRDAYVDTAIYLIYLPEIDLDIQDSRGWTALHFALHRHVLVHALLEAGAAVNITLPHGGQNALHIALKTVAASELPPILSELLRYGADVNGMSSYGTPMHCAVRTRARSIVEVLLRESRTPPDLTIQDSYGQTAMDLAFQLQYDEIGHLLEEYQSDLKM